MLNKLDCLSNDFYKNCSNLKPKSLIIDDVKWKFLLRSVVSGKNILLVGPTGCGKTFAAKSVSKIITSPENFHYFNLGSMQDPRSALIGNTNFDKSTGTVFNESSFIKAIRNKDSIILLDELSRANNDVFNILMTVLDELQRYIRLDEKSDNNIVYVEKGVTFIATANIGIEYTATRIIDIALLDRFPVIIEMDMLNKDAEFELMVDRHSIKDKFILDNLKNLIEIADHTRLQVKQADGKLTRFISTRSISEMVELLISGFSLLEIAECLIYPLYDQSGEMDSERTYIKQVVQKYIPSDSVNKKLFFNLTNL